jgi:hypothetical protein
VENDFGAARKRDTGSGVAAGAGGGAGDDENRFEMLLIMRE